MTPPPAKTPARAAAGTTPTGWLLLRPCSFGRAGSPRAATGGGGSRRRRLPQPRRPRAAMVPTWNCHRPGSPDLLHPGSCCGRYHTGRQPGALQYTARCPEGPPCGRPARAGTHTSTTTRVIRPGLHSCGQIAGSTTAHRVQRERCPSASMWMSPSVLAPSTTVPRVPSGQTTRSPLSGGQPSPEESPASAHDSAMTSTIFPGMLTPSRSPACAAPRFAGRSPGRPPDPRRSAGAARYQQEDSDGTP